jgi:hypothetical protein
VRNALGVIVVALLTGIAVMASGGLAPASQSDLDDFMSRVLARRDENWKKLQQYVLDERERVEMRGPAGIPLWGEAREYTWYIRDGFFVRSPTKANGVSIGESDRREYEEEFLKRAKDRDQKREKPTGAAPSPAPERVPQDMPSDTGTVLAQVRQPQFMDSAYFLKFKFEQGKYALVGREKFEGRDVLRIEYYPTRLFTHEQDDEAKRKRENRKDRGEDYEAQMEKMMNKVALVTLWVEPAAHQIVKYAFDNVNLDFLPAAWLVRLSDLKATMTMSQPFPDVWLPRDVEMLFEAMLAIGPINMKYHLDYHDYRQATTSGRIK